ncbi:UNVERIFIED_CONTAM: hypothetical protein RMT77_011098 [Armadillidium vulgare]
MLIALICSLTILLMTSSVENSKAPEGDKSVSDQDSPSDPLESSCPYSPKLHLENPIRIGAWNTQRLGKSKIGKKDVVKVIIQVMLRYDIIVIEEVVDAESEVPYILLERLNEAAYFQEGRFDPNDALRDPAEDVYKCALSQRLGRTRYKEQYAVYYRVDRVKLNQTYQYPDKTDVFHIEPFVSVFSTPDVENFAVIPIHTSPNDAEKEIDALIDVYDDVVVTLGVRDAIILGDFNAGCDYVIGSDWPNIRLRTDPKFKWLISDHIDTTTTGTSCPYDRIVVTGENLLQFVYKESAQPFYFDEEFHLKKKLVSKVSDHYPVGVLLGSNITTQDGGKPSVEVETGITIKLQYNKYNFLNLKESCETVLQQHERCSDESCSIKFNNTRGEEHESEREPLESKGKNQTEDQQNNCGGVPHLIKSTTDSFVSKIFFSFFASNVYRHTT